MLGLGLLVRLGRQVLAGPVADAGLLPTGYYRHLVLAALEEEDFSRALHHLKWADDPLLAQIIILRLRLLMARHRRQSAAVQTLLRSDQSDSQRERGQALLDQETMALDLLQDYEDQALAYLGIPGTEPAAESSTLKSS
jgi:hypothetical protein